MLFRSRRSFSVANLTYQNDVRILAEDGSERRCERESRLLMNLHLNDSRDSIFDRVFHRDDVDAAVLQQS